ncbi:hypothetical protein Q4491_09430 [Photobacterium sp. 2_MG-2023]|uniref:hypothetical protein n=1 Tax=Photobacterium sp. 2_MG-2023 TaxID=3062663 RepID=UPI0026E30F8A|nr:hypothetical protein [Photobacterium sp. 2_MG-2023]MDO6581566.1 hypothetical protein [Photobacterium sp. 2_MG-2023]
MPTEEEVQELYNKIKSDPDKIEWEVITSDQAYPSRRKYYIACTTVLFVLLMFMINLFVSSFDVVETITHPLTWMMSGAAVFANLTIGRITMFPLFRYHYILSRYGLITEDHVHSSKTGNVILRQLLAVAAVAAVGSLAAVFIIGPSALAGFAGLGVTWLVLSGTNLDKYMLSQQGESTYAHFLLTNKFSRNIRTIIEQLICLEPVVDG